MSEAITVAAFGDSITLAARQTLGKRWIGLVESRLKSEYPDLSVTFVNAGIGGNTSREGLVRIEKDVLVHNPDYVFVEFGGNDATNDLTRHVSFNEYYSNLKAIRDKLNENGSPVIMMITFPPVIDELHQWSNDPFFKEYDGLEGMVEKYREITKEFAEENGFDVIDINKAILEQGEINDIFDYILPDGVHLTEGGNRVVAETVYPCLKKALAQDNVIQ